MLPLIHDFFTSCPSRMGRGGSFKPGKTRKFLGKMLSWRLGRNQSIERTQSDRFCLPPSV